MYKSLFIASIVCLLSNVTFSQRASNESGNADLLYWANQLIQNINQHNTSYEHKTDNVKWDDNGTYSCYTDCSGFMNALIKKAFRWNDEVFKKKLGHRHMRAYHYYNAIVSGNQFIQIKNIAQIQPGDIIALQYADRSEHEDNTGHVMLIITSPEKHRDAKIVLPQTRQYTVSIIDCSKSPHGQGDSRFLPNGSEYSGLGKGVFRLYTNMQGDIVAYSWSMGNPKASFNPYENPVVVGRFFENKVY